MASKVMHLNAGDLVTVEDQYGEVRLYVENSEQHASVRLDAKQAKELADALAALSTILAR